jgi:hypothetical protein
MRQYRFIYCGESYRRMMWGVIADSRVNIPGVKNANGWTIKAYVDSQIALVGPGVAVYKLETNLGVLAGYMGLYTGPGQVGVIFKQIRPAFVSDLINFNKNIANFITGNDWVFDTLS